jgi:ketosteroid isomerase-like protein
MSTERNKELAAELFGPVRDGKISAVREYLDTQHVVATWFQP